MFETEWVEALSISKVHNLDGVKIGHHDVVGLKVQVEDAVVVEVLYCLEDLDQVNHHIVLRVTEPYVSKTMALTDDSVAFNSRFSYFKLIFNSI